MHIIQRSLVLTAILYALINPLEVQAQAEVKIGFFEPYRISPGNQLEVPVMVANAREVYAVDLEIHFNPNVLRAQDADSSTPGIQMGMGTFLDPGLVLYNEVDNDQGIARLVMTQINPSEAKSGDGVLLVLYFYGLTSGESSLTVTSLLVSDRAGVQIPSESVDSVIQVTTSAPESRATAIPVVEPTALQWIPTAATNFQETAAGGVDAQEQLTNIAQAGEQETEPGKQFLPQIQTASVLAEEEPLPWLVKNWWIVVLAAVVGASLGLVVYRNR